VREFDVPGQEILHAIDWVIGDLSEHLAQVRFRIKTVQLRRSDQTIEGGRTFSAPIRSREQVVLSIM
jgi:hypothetical protein